MTPKEKARQLINRFIEDGLHEKYMGVKSARQCALILVEEILSNDGWSSSREEWDIFTNYWIEVKKELDKK